MERAQAEQRAFAFANEAHVEDDDSPEIVRDATIRKPYGWICFYQSRLFLTTGNPSARLAGNGPLVVLEDGTVHALGSAQSIGKEIADFEEAMNL